MDPWPATGPFFGPLVLNEPAVFGWLKQISTLVVGNRREALRPAAVPRGRPEADALIAQARQKTMRAPAKNGTEFQINYPTRPHPRNSPGRGDHAVPHREGLLGL